MALVKISSTRRFRRQPGPKARSAPEPCDDFLPQQVAETRVFCSFFNLPDDYKNAIESVDWGEAKVIGYERNMLKGESIALLSVGPKNLPCCH